MPELQLAQQSDGGYDLVVAAAPVGVPAVLVVGGNIGSSVGTSMVTTLLARRAQFHQSVLSYHTTRYDPAFRDQVAGLAQQLAHSGATPPDARAQALGRVYQSMQAQAATLSYLDTFMVLAIGAGIMFVLAFIIRRNDPTEGGEVAVG